ncbi:MAG: hypothetical protein EOM05_02380 [Clostridia bacterium]|nr:hypothetical protein [Clostridia bacterium]
MKTYLVKKDVNKPGAEDNWIIMNGHEFARFIKTEDGQKRKRNFARLEQCDICDDAIIIECDAHKAKELESKRQCERYRRNANSGFAVFSYDYPVHGRETLCGGDVICDIAVDVETLVLERIRNEVLYDALGLLTPMEQDLIEQLFLSNEPILLREYAEQNGICIASAHGRKVRAFRKLKNYFEKCGYGSEFFA